MSFKARTTQQDSDSETVSVELMLVSCEREVERK